MIITTIVIFVAIERLDLWISDSVLGIEIALWVLHLCHLRIGSALASFHNIKPR